MSYSMSAPISSSSSAGFSDSNVYTIPASQPIGQLQYYDEQEMSAYPTMMTSSEYDLNQEVQSLYTKLAQKQADFLNVQKQLSQMILTAQVAQQELQNCRLTLQDTQRELAQLKQEQHTKKVKSFVPLQTPLQPDPKKPEQKAPAPTPLVQSTKKISKTSQKQWKKTK